ncbi:hypothetical protein COT99_03645 [Candidatus Falkowbacteria bacterium CG10_big_fil_rev_8_21_14_0_10_43_10]|uniref:Type II toxin-antitoxin system RelE/ParE family toxin n=1 Tax=Candidatus Falkowbacteria bacterium CG10_big_fil_rev_8_21_14_0_10_43_10 TaxID=1974567 RepID=A0A2H0V1F1_9BACT|nr:MAG: hypothetical protein COT99_03645 [Candidatus Falkowbacteria bacterium CG10_big_fil_rev_8_21_14_0_10_43_10]
MNKIAKALKKLSGKEAERVKKMLESLKAGSIANLEIKKLKGRKDVFRVREGSIRIIYRRAPDGSFFVLSIERRSDTTYNF